ncbi:MAG: hypothetical protein KDC52_19790 [Ignavibacteriae bacterium]|nr:hypothetical protein [Ignavibacteriota bacterium]
MNKNILLLTISFIYSLSLSSQVINTSNVNYKSFDDGTTYFIQSENTELNSAIESILEKYWTINNFQMVTESQVPSEPNEKSFYLGFFTYNFSREAGRTGALDMDYSVTQLILFKALSESKKDKRKPIETLATVELNEITPVDILQSIQILQSQIKFVKKLDTKKRLDFKELLSEICEQRKIKIKDKTLYLNEYQLSPRLGSKEDVEKVYSLPFEIKSKEEIEEAILNQEPNIVYAKFVRLRTLHFLVIIDAENSDILYGKVSTGFTQNMVGPRFLKDISK